MIFKLCSLALVVTLQRSSGTSDIAQVSVHPMSFICKLVLTSASGQLQTAHHHPSCLFHCQSAFWHSSGAQAHVGFPLYIRKNPKKHRN